MSTALLSSSHLEVLDTYICLLVLVRTQLGADKLFNLHTDEVSRLQLPAAFQNGTQLLTAAH